MRKIIVVGALVAAFLAFAGSAAAVKFGEPDGNGHPYAGLVVFYEDGTPLWRCTGALISPTKFLTAGHCAGEEAGGTPEPDHAEIWFSSGPIGAADGYPFTGDASGTPIEHPGWNGLLTLPDTHDVGVVILDEPRGGPYAQVAPVGYLNGLASKRGQQDVELTVVGYGLQSVKPVLSQVRERMVGTVKVVQLKSSLTDGFNVRTSNDPGQGHGGSGGTCFGDSGGPVLDGHLVVGVNSFVLNANCQGSSYAYRVDTTAAQAFINGTN